MLSGMTFATILWCFLNVSYYVHHPVLHGRFFYFYNILTGLDGVRCTCWLCISPPFSCTVIPLSYISLFHPATSLSRTVHPSSTSTFTSKMPPIPGFHISARKIYNFHHTQKSSNRLAPPPTHYTQPNPPLSPSSNPPQNVLANSLEFLVHTHLDRPVRRMRESFHAFLQTLRDPYCATGTVS